MKCIRCDKTLEAIDHFHPYDGVSFTTYGHYGTTFFDPMDGRYLQIVVCDPCLVENDDPDHINRG